MSGDTVRSGLITYLALQTQKTSESRFEVHLLIQSFAYEESLEVASASVDPGVTSRPFSFNF